MGDGKVMFFNIRPNGIDGQDEKHSLQRSFVIMKNAPAKKAISASQHINVSVHTCMLTWAAETPNTCVEWCEKIPVAARSKA
jgi:hypothetical protein